MILYCLFNLYILHGFYLKLPHYDYHFIWKYFCSKLSFIFLVSVIPSINFILLFCSHLFLYILLIYFRANWCFFDNFICKSLILIVSMIFFLYIYLFYSFFLKYFIKAQYLLFLIEPIIILYLLNLIYI
jgi:hypothetical protein